MNPDYDDCLKRGKIKPFSRGRALAGKELETAAADLSRAVCQPGRKAYQAMKLPLKSDTF